MITFSIKMNFILSLQLFDFSKGLKNVETAVVNEPSVSDQIYPTKLQNTTQTSRIPHRENNAPQNRDLFWFSIEYLNINKSVTRCKTLIQYTYMVLLPNIKIYEIKY